MLFNSWLFILFFLAVYLGYLRLRHRAQNYFLLLASYMFYACWDYRFVSLLLISTIVDYVCTHRLERTARPIQRKLLLLMSIAVNLGLLGVFKYYDFFVQSLVEAGARFGIEFHITTLKVILPVGISFYTFQTMGYTIDVYRRKVQACPRFIDFALFVAFFPQLVAGPIERAGRLLGQVQQPRNIRWQDIGDGLWLIAQGYFLKVVVADNLAKIVDPVFAMESPSGEQALLALYAFAFQIYGDFAGYSRIARGIGKLMGFHLIDNFRQPYFATGPSQFWSRWHISLSTWLRDYLYIPLGGNRAGRTRTYVNLMLTMLLGGLWHGAAWNFVLWGGFHGLLLVVFRRNRVESKTAPRPGSMLWDGFRAFLFFHVTCFGWLLFRCTTLDQVGTLTGALLGLDAWAMASVEQLPAVVFLMCSVLILDLFTECVQALETGDGARLGAAQGDLPTTKITAKAFGVPVPILMLFVGVPVLILMLFLIGVRGGTEFIYFQF